MDWPSVILLFILGSLFGSFINVVAIRYNTGRSYINGRSSCPNCNTELKWFELIPIFSFIFLYGRCRICGNKISWQYPIIEILTGILFVGVAMRELALWPVYSGFPNGLIYTILFFVYYVFIFSLLTVIAVYDVCHKIIPNQLVYLFIFLSVAKLILFFYIKDFQLNSIDWLDLLSPIAMFLPFAFLWKVSDGRWMGFGDAKLAFGIGALLGFVSGVSVIILSFWLGAIWSIGLIVYNKIFGKGKSVHMSTEIPFAPFLILAVIIIFFSHLDIFGLNNFLSLL